MLSIRKKRIEKGWSLTRVSGLTGIAASDLSQMERELKPDFPGWKRRLARAFGVPAGKLFREPK